MKHNKMEIYSRSFMVIVVRLSWLRQNNVDFVNKKESEYTWVSDRVLSFKSHVDLPLKAILRENNASIV